MKTPRFCWGVALGLLASSPSSQAADLPKAMDAAPCQSAPTIDGVIGAEEWRDAPVHAFEMNMIRIDPHGHRNTAL